MYPEITTNRLRLNPLLPIHLDAIHRLWIEPQVRRYLWDDRQISRSEAEAIIDENVSVFAANNYGLLAVSFRERPGLIGFGGFWRFSDPPELQLLYGLAPAHWGRGLATFYSTSG